MLKFVHLLLASIPLVACQATERVSPIGERGARSASPRSASPRSASPRSASPRSASLGIATSVPSEGLAREMELGFDVRQEGRLVTAVTEGSAAFQAGLRDGDVLLRLDDVTLYSQDDIDDYVSVHDPGDRVTATVIRGDSHEEAELLVELGVGAARSPEDIQWQYASLAQLPTALERARARKKKVLVGLSGAET